MRSLLLAAMWLGVSVSAPAIAEDRWKVHDIVTGDVDHLRISIRDINQDGLLDVAAVGTRPSEEGVVRVFLHPGRAVVQKTWNTSLEQAVKSPRDVAILDFDGNGLLDVVVSQNDPKAPLSWHRFVPQRRANGSTMNWTAEEVDDKYELPVGARLAVAPLNPFAGAELILAGRGNEATVGWLERRNANGAALYLDRFNMLESMPGSSPIVEDDVNADGMIDLVFLHPGPKQPGIHWLVNPGPGSVSRAGAWQHGLIGGESDDVTAVAFGYLDGGSLVDVAAATRSGFVRLYQQDSKRPLTWKTSVIPPAYNAQAGTCIAMADMSGNGRTDLIHGATHKHGEATLVCFRHNVVDQKPVWVVDPIGVLPQGTFETVFPCDLDLDGDLDLLVLQRDSGVGKLVWYENRR